MTKPRVFVSSTYYDLKHIRASLEAFIQSLGYESVLFESGDIPFSHTDPLDISCNNAVETVHIFVLIIGGRYGSHASDQNRTAINDETSNALDKKYEFYNSITLREYETAKAKGIPIYTFVEKGVAAEYETFKKNRHIEIIDYAHVDNTSIFKLIEKIYSSPTNNQIKNFESFDDISSWLRHQWAGLFAEHLTKIRTDSALMDLAAQIAKINDVASALQSYSEAIIRKVEDSPEESASIIAPIQAQLLVDLLKNTPLVSKFIRDHLERTYQVFDVDLLVKQIKDAPDLSDFLKSMNLSAKQSTMAMRDSAYFESLNSALIRQYRLLRKSISELPQLKNLFKDAPPLLDPFEAIESKFSYTQWQVGLNHPNGDRNQTD